MKRWSAAFLVALLAALPILLAWNRSPALLRDSDTRGILAAIRQAHDPLKWFCGDWPIANHFYRPVVSLVFEADNALYGDKASGYGLTNALLCFACPLLLFWFLRELTNRPWVSALGASVFALWHVGLIGPLSSLVFYLAWATLVIGAVRHRRAWRAYLPAVLTLLALSDELLPIRPLQFRMIDWVPGRTASTMTVFALVAMGAYARYERLRRPARQAQEPTPETPPATRNTETVGKRGNPLPWALVAVAATALALGTYEQAVMLPPVLGVVALAFKWEDRSNKSYKIYWTFHTAFWSLLVAYAALRWGLLPHDASGYQKQQFSSTRTAFWGVMEYLFPPLGDLLGIPTILESGSLMLLQSTPYTPLITATITATGYLQSSRERGLFLVGLVGSAVAYLPMAWFKIFEHYHYWPMALRAALVAALGSAALRLMVTAWNPPDLPAPPRPRPAPGSLPRP